MVQLCALNSADKSRAPLPLFPSLVGSASGGGGALALPFVCACGGTSLRTVMHAPLVDTRLHLGAARATRSCLLSSLLRVFARATFSCPLVVGHEPFPIFGLRHHQFNHRYLLRPSNYIYSPASLWNFCLRILLLANPELSDCVVVVGMHVASCRNRFD